MIIERPALQGTVVLHREQRRGRLLNRTAQAVAIASGGVKELFCLEVFSRKSL